MLYQQVAYKSNVDVDVIKMLNYFIHDFFMSFGNREDHNQHSFGHLLYSGFTIVWRNSQNPTSRKLQFHLNRYKYCFIPEYFQNFWKLEIRLFEKYIFTRLLKQIYLPQSTFIFFLKQNLIESFMKTGITFTSKT